MIIYLLLALKFSEVFLFFWILITLASYTMLLKYSLTEQDYLDFTLFTASQSERINKKKRFEQVCLSLLAAAVTIIFFLNDNLVMTLYSGLTTVITVIFYPVYFRKQYKKHYQAFIKETYSKYLGEPVTVELNPDHIFLKDKSGENRIYLSEIEVVNETDQHFFMKLNSAISILIPKRELNDIAALRKMFEHLGLSVQEFVSWEWK